MFTRLKNRVMTAVTPENPVQDRHFQNQIHMHRNLPDKFIYGRPIFLQLLTFDELKASADHIVRPIIVPRDISVMPLSAGYAECVNSGKSEWNEDQAAFRREVLSHPLKKYPDLPYIYFGIFDGHAGYGAALAAAQQFHHILHEKLVDDLDNLLQNQTEAERLAKLHPVDKIHHPLMFHKQISKDELIIGALESTFTEMDTVLAEDRDKYRNSGGCTACVALFILGKLFVANAGDSRGIVCHRVVKDNLEQKNSLINLTISTATSLTSNSNRNIYGNGSSDFLNNDGEMVVFPIPFSYDHTPDTERSRLMTTAILNRSYMGNDYIAMEYATKPQVKDLGTRILYRCGGMKGWTYKTLTREDLKMPIVTGEGKRSRLLGTIGVTRGFGDHDLRALGSGLLIKPFLSAHPEVNYRDLTKITKSSEDAENEDGDFGILVMATDGLWDVADNETVSRTVFATLDKYPKERHKYTMVAQELVAKSRGRVNESGHWRLSDSKAAATVDDISVIVIPVYQYYKEYIEWEKTCATATSITTNLANGNNDDGTQSGDEDDDLTEEAIPENGDDEKGKNSDVEDEEDDEINKSKVEESEDPGDESTATNISTEDSSR